MSAKFSVRILLCALAMSSFLTHLRAQDQDAAAQPRNAPFEVSTGTRFLIGLKEKLDTGKDRAGMRFTALTLEPLYAPDGSVLPIGEEVRGHISKVEPAGITGRARLWLSFDDVRTRRGRTPLIAEVVQVPGEHSVKQGDTKEGEIEARTSDRKRDLEATAGGAAMGAAAGAHHSPKDAAIGAAAGAAAAFFIASGYGQELVLEKGAKLELELLRPLVLSRR